MARLLINRHSLPPPDLAGGGVGVGREVGVHLLSHPRHGNRSPAAPSSLPAPVRDQFSPRSSPVGCL